MSCCRYRALSQRARRNSDELPQRVFANVVEVVNHECRNNLVAESKPLPVTARIEGKTQRPFSKKNDKLGLPVFDQSLVVKMLRASSGLVR